MSDREGPSVEALAAGAVIFRRVRDRRLREEAQRAAAVERLMAEREAQGLPRKITDPAVLAKVATLMRPKSPQQVRTLPDLQEYAEHVAQTEVEDERRMIERLKNMTDEDIARIAAHPSPTQMLGNAMRKKPKA